MNNTNININNTNNNIINETKQIFNRMNSADNLMPTLSKTASIEYQSLFRGLSTFEIDSFPSTLIDPTTNKQDKSNTNPTNNNNNNNNTNQELTDMLLKQQDDLNNAENNNNNNHSNGFKLLTRLNTVKGIKIEQNDINNRDLIDTSENNDSIIEHLTNNKLNSLTKTREKINNKRLSTTSNTSSTASSSTTTTTTTTTTNQTNNKNLTNEPKRRGRRPISSNPDNIQPLSKKQRTINESEKKLVYFGNKLVEKETEEYEKRRNNNNDAVKKCREKLAREQKEKEERLKTLADENARLTNTVESMSKELNLLKSIIVKMSPDQKLPEYLDQLIKNVDEDS